MALITVEEADAHLRLDLLSGDEREDDLLLKMEQATEIVIDYLKLPDHEWDDEDVPYPIKAAILIVLSALWDDRDGTGDGDYLKTDGSVTRLLHRFRDPAIA